MASNQTANLGLSQWEADDEILRADFNADNAKLDAAVAALEGRVVAGSVTAKAEQSTSVELGFQPKLLLVCSGKPYFAICTGSSCVQIYGTDNTSFGSIKTGPFQLTATGFYLSPGSYPLTSINCATTTLRYFAIR